MYVGGLSGQGRRSCFHRFVGTVRAAGAYQTSRHLIGAPRQLEVVSDFRFSRTLGDQAVIFSDFFILLATLRICLIAQEEKKKTRAFWLISQVRMETTATSFFSDGVISSFTPCELERK